MKFRLVCLFGFLLATTVTASAAGNVPDPIFNGHEEWFVCATDSDCITVEQICGNIVETGAPIAMEPVINRRFETAFKEFVSGKISVPTGVTATGHEVRPDCNFPTPAGTRVYKCVNYICAATYE